jgi:hypothetical protein
VSSKQHLNATFFIDESPFDSKSTAVEFNLINKSQMGFKITPIKLALANAAGLSKGNAFVTLSDITYKKPDAISIGKKISVVNRLNPSFNVAALNALLNSFGSSAIVNATNEFVTHVPIFAP